MWLWPLLFSAHKARTTLSLLAHHYHVAVCDRSQVLLSNSHVLENSCTNASVCVCKQYFTMLMSACNNLRNTRISSRKDMCRLYACMWIYISHATKQHGFFTSPISDMEYNIHSCYFPDYCLFTLFQTSPLRLIFL